MYKDKKILAIIPARGGSKGLPEKNIKPLLGQPLLAWTIKQAQASMYLDMILVSTEDEEIAKVAADFGAKIPFFRPTELAADNSPTMEAIEFTLNELEKKGLNFDAIVILEPTSPLRKLGDIDRAIKMLFDNENNCDAVISLGEIQLESPFIAKIINQDYLEPLIKNEYFHQRQQLTKTYFPYGVVYLAKTDKLLESKTFYMKRAIPMLIERWQNYEIDDLYDFICIEAIIKLKKEDIL